MFKLRELLRLIGLDSTMLDFFDVRRKTMGGCTIRHDNEYCTFMDTMKYFGITYNTWHQLPKEKWQDIVSAEGYGITSLATFGLVIDHMMFVFSTGKPHWVVEPSGDETGINEVAFGPEAAFLYAYDNKENKVIHRRNIGQSGRPYGDAIGVEAMAIQYQFCPVPKDTATEADIRKHDEYMNSLLNDGKPEPESTGKVIEVEMFPNLTSEKEVVAINAMDEKDQFEHRAYMILRALHEQFSLRDLIALGQKQGYFGPEVMAQLYGRPNDGLPDADNMTIPQVLDGVRDSQEKFLRTLAGQE